MIYRELDKDVWENFFNFVSRYIHGLHLEVEVASLNIGDQIEKEWVLMEGLSYDPKDDVLYVHLAELNHAISEPVTLIVAEENGWLRSVSAKDKAGALHVLLFREPLLLEASPRIANESHG